MMGLIGGFAQHAGYLGDGESEDGSDVDIASISVLSKISSVVPEIPVSLSNMSLLSSKSKEIQIDEGFVMKKYPNGEIYEGPIVDGLRHGNGAVSIRPDGSKFSGCYRSDEPYLGTLITSEYTYIGHFKKGDFHGLATIMYPDGSVYNGEFEDGLRHGVGKETTLASEDEEMDSINKDKDSRSSEISSPSSTPKRFQTYTGDFYMGKRHGIGALEDVNGDFIYKGLFINGNLAKFKEDEDSNESSTANLEEKKE